jgi:hypothetical protein
VDNVLIGLSALSRAGDDRAEETRRRHTRTAH